MKPRPCIHAHDLRRFRWTPGSMVEDVTRRACPQCGTPWGPTRYRCTATLKTWLFLSPDQRCRLPAPDGKLCRIHAEVARWAR